VLITLLLLVDGATVNAPVLVVNALAVARAVAATMQLNFMVIDMLIDQLKYYLLLHGNCG
jgi:hypothetical protein